jgi:hypothetical protein
MTAPGRNPERDRPGDGPPDRPSVGPGPPPDRPPVTPEPPPDRPGPVKPDPAADVVPTTGVGLSDPHLGGSEQLPPAPVANTDAVAAAHATLESNDRWRAADPARRQRTVRSRTEPAHIFSAIALIDPHRRTAHSGAPHGSVPMKPSQARPGSLCSQAVLRPRSCRCPESSFGSRLRGLSPIWQRARREERAHRSPAQVTLPPEK